MAETTGTVVGTDEGDANKVDSANKLSEFGGWVPLAGSAFQGLVRRRAAQNTGAVASSTSAQTQGTSAVPSLAASIVHF